MIWLAAAWAAVKQYAWVGAFLLATAAGAWLAHQSMSGQVERAEAKAYAAQEDAKNLRKASAARDRADVVRERERTRVNNQTKENHDRTVEALRRNPEWAAQPVPDAVLDSLRAAAQAARTQPAKPGAVRE